MPFLRLRTALRIPLLFVALTALSLRAEETATAPAAPADPAVELARLTGLIQGKAMMGARSAAEFATEMAEFDQLLETFADQNTEPVARIAMTRAILRAQLGAEEEAILVDMQAVVARFPGTEAAEAAAGIVQRLEDAKAKAEAAAHLEGSPAPEIHFNWSNQDGLTTLSDLKGKVVVLDFWATWCGPCIRSFPEVRELTAHYANSPVAVVGVTSLQGRVHGLEATPIDTRDDPQREYDLTADFIAAKDITWTIAFSEERVFNEDYGVDGIPHMVIIAPDGTVRHNNLHPAMPHAEKTAMIDAILREFDLPIPPAE